MQYELSDNDIISIIKRYKPSFGKRDIIKYPDLRYFNINLLLPKNNDFKIVFFINNITKNCLEGHWCVLTKRNSKFFWFDPYGKSPDDEEKWLTHEERISLGENRPILHEIIPNDLLSWNKIDFQSKREGVNTCGRWCCFFCIYCCILGHSIQQMHDYIEQLKRHTGLSNDKIICKLV